MKGKIFNTQEVQAIIAGNKTQFRQICKKQPKGELEQPYVIRDMGIGRFHYPFGKCPYQVGQKIFCKETFAEIEFGGGMGYNSGKQMIYKVDDDYDVKWKPAQHMKQKHSRLTLEITEIKVERLQDISEKDCIKEGMEKMWLEENEDFPRYTFGKHSFFEVKEVFRDWWNETHKKPEEKFEANPFVWVVDFKINK